jgi:hypothetical protein
MENASEKNMQVDYDDVIYKKSFSAFNGYNYSIGAEIIVKVDSDGVLKPGNPTFSGAVPCKIEFHTANDNGKLYKAGEFDKAGRFITREHWSVTASPSGNPLILVANTSELGNGPKLNFRRSRGTFYKPKSVEYKDIVFNISWYAHDGQSYKEVSTISAIIEDTPKLGFLPTSLIFKTFDEKTGFPTDSLKINCNKSIEVKSLKSLVLNGSIEFNSPLKLTHFNNEEERDMLLTNPEIGSLIFLLNQDTVQVFTKTKGWKNLI